jgi:hypothetical protein
MEAFKPEESIKPYISFGNGGGFTGKTKTYYLTAEGVIYTKSDTSYEMVSKISKKQAEQIFNNYSMLGLNKIDLNEPGNKYYFIEKVDAGVTSKILWGNSPLENNNIDIFYINLMQLIKDAKNLKK